MGFYDSQVSQGGPNGRTMTNEEIARANAGPAVDPSINPETGQKYTREEGNDAYVQSMYDKLATGQDTSRIDYNAITRETADRENEYRNIAYNERQKAMPTTDYTNANAAYGSAMGNTQAAGAGLLRAAAGLGDAQYSTKLGQGAVGAGAQAYGQATGQLDQSAQFRQAQQGQMGYLQRAQAGQAPSVAQAQLQAGSDAAIAAQMSAAAGARGSNAAGAMYDANNNAAQIMGQTNQQAAALRAQEIATATGQLGDVMNQGRAGDVAAAQGYGQAAQGMVNAGATYGQLSDAQRNAAMGYNDIAGTQNTIAGTQNTLGNSYAANAQWDTDAQMRQRVNNNAIADQYFNRADAQSDAAYNSVANAEQLRSANYMQLRAIKEGQSGSGLAPALIQGGATVLGTGIGAMAGGVGAPAGAAVGAAAGNAAAKAV